jgi:hypothetical protein
MEMAAFESALRFFDQSQPPVDHEIRLALVDRLLPTQRDVILAVDDVLFPAEWYGRLFEYAMEQAATFQGRQVDWLCAYRPWELDIAWSRERGDRAGD